MGKMILVPEETWMEIQRILHSVTEKMGEAVKEGKEEHESIKGFNLTACELNSDYYKAACELTEQVADAVKVGVDNEAMRKERAAIHEMQKPEKFRQSYP